MRFAGAAALLMAGCSLFEGDPAERVLEGAGHESITVGELEERTRNFADRYVQVLADACDALKASAGSAALRREAHLLKLRSATSAFDIVTSSHPLQETLDLLVQVELQHLVWVEEGRAGELFGDPGRERLAPALKTARGEIEGLALKAMPRRRLAEVGQLVRDWRARNPDVGNVTFVRFGPFLDEPGKNLASRILTGFGILNLSHLNPLEPASESVDQARKTADDAFYFGKRLPVIVDWEAEAATHELLAALEAGTNLAEPRSLLKEAGETARAVRGSLEALERITNKPKDPREPPSRPLDVTEVARTAREVREALAEFRGLAESPAWSRRMEEMTEGAEFLLEQAFAAALLLLIAFFALRAGFQAISLRLRARTADSNAPPSRPSPL